MLSLRIVTLEYISVFAVMIQQAFRQEIISNMGRIVRTISLNLIPRPFILIELFCRRDRVVIYLDKMLMNPIGKRIGIAGEKNNTMVNIIKKAECSL